MDKELNVENSEILKDLTKLPNFDDFEGQGGAFLVSPVDQYKVFSK